MSIWNLNSIWCYLGCASLFLLLINPTKSATDELQISYTGPRLDINNNDRIKQIMKGASNMLFNPKLEKAAALEAKVSFDELNTTYDYDANWPRIGRQLGAVSAVSFDTAGNVVIFQRGDRIWDQMTFNSSNHYQQRRLGAINENTVLGIVRDSGELLYEWGKNLFYMPHGLTIDKAGNTWLTDVALHQVFKFGPDDSGNGKRQLLLTLGLAFQPGAGDTRLCKPTSVAVLDNGDFFVADGYCNARIIKYTANGEKILQWGQNSFAGASIAVAPPNYFAIPHALTLVPEKRWICTADRENGRVQCFLWTNGTYQMQYHSQIIGDRLFSVDYSPANGGMLVIVNGPRGTPGSSQLYDHEVSGFVVNVSTTDIVSKFAPANQIFENPHDVAVTSDGMEIYVAELSPARVLKFVKKGAAVSSAVNTSPVPAHNYGRTARGGPSPRSILVATLMLLFVAITFVVMLLTKRYRRRGNLATNSLESPEMAYSQLAVSTTSL